MDGERIADIYRELGFPNAPKFQTALRKRGINVSLDNLKELIKTLGSRQIFRPPPQYKGNVASRSIDDRWVADVLSFESKPVEGVHQRLADPGRLQSLSLGHAHGVQEGDDEGLRDTPGDRRARVSRA